MMFCRRVAVLRRAALRTFLGGTVAAGLGGLRVLAAEKLPDTDTLSSLYAEAVEAMVDVPGCDAISSPEGVLYLAPASGAPVPMEWPKIISRSVIFSLTAWNPNGQTAPEAANTAANIRLEADIESLRLHPRATWRSFGFNDKEGWREEGFSLAYDPAERRFARSEVGRLAGKYHQAAFYVRWGIYVF